MYELLPLRNDAAELERVARLLSEAFPADRRFTAQYLDWMYLRNPLGSAVGWNAVKDGELAAHYVTLPVLAHLQGAVRRGLLSLNTATHPRHQGQKLFTRLAEKTYQEAADRGFEFVMGVSNANSTPGFTRKLGFDLICPLDARLGFGHIDDSDEGDAGLEFFRVWSEEALEWRLSRPAFHYSVTKRGESCHVCAPTGKPGIKALLFRGRGRPLAPRGGWLPAPVTVYLGVDPHLRWRHKPYFELPRRLRPSPLNLILKSLGAERFELSRDTVRLQALDFDAW